MGRHEIDGFGRDVFGRKHQVTFVFAIFFVHQNDHPPSAQIGDNFFHRSNACRKGR